MTLKRRILQFHSEIVHAIALNRYVRHCWMTPFTIIATSIERCKINEYWAFTFASHDKHGYHSWLKFCSVWNFSWSGFLSRDLLIIQLSCSGFQNQRPSQSACILVCSFVAVLDEFFVLFPLWILLCLFLNFLCVRENLAKFEIFVVPSLFFLFSGSFLLLLLSVFSNWL